MKKDEARPSNVHHVTTCFNGKLARKLLGKCIHGHFTE